MITSLSFRAECQVVLWRWGVRAGKTHPKHPATSVYIYLFKVAELLPVIQFCSVLIFYLLLHSKNDDIFGFISRLELSCVYLVQLRGRVLFPVVLVWQLPHVPSRHSSSLCTSFNFIKMRKYTEILASFHKKLFHRSRWISKVFFSALQDIRMHLSQH